MSDISLQTRFRKSDEVAVRDLDDEAVLVNLTSGVYFGLNPVGTRMWHLIGEQRDLEGVIVALCNEFDAPAATIEADLLGLVAQLVDRGLLVRA